MFCIAYYIVYFIMYTVIIYRRRPLPFAPWLPTCPPPCKRRNVTWTAQASAAVAYTCISLSTAYYFGKSVNGSCNINWVLYHPGANGLWTPLGAFLGRAVAYFVVFFPALDVTSVYPLNVMVSRSRPQRPDKPLIKPPPRVLGKNNKIIVKYR